MDFFKQQAASFLESQKDEEPHKKKPAAASESEESHSSSAGGYGGEPTKQEHKKAQDDDVPSYQELMSSASVLMEAAKGKFGGGAGAGDGEGKEEHGKKAETDPAKLAAAAQDLIDAAQHYGKFDESSQIGGYLKKAEGYLHSYQKNPREAEAAVRDASATRDGDEAALPEERR